MLSLFQKVKPFMFLTNMWFLQNEPVSIVHFVTNRCNARCSFCFIDFDDGFTQNKTNELSVEDYKKLAINLGNDLHHLNFTGGEPFLRSDFPSIDTT